MGTGTRSKKGTGTGAGAGTQKKGTRKNKGYTVSPSALAQRRNIHNTLPARTPEEHEYNTRLIAHIMQVQEIATHVDKRDPVSLRSAFINYLRLCQENGFRVSNMAAYCAMGVSHTCVDTWLKSNKEEFKELALFVKTTCALSREELISDNKLNPVIGIFWQRNFDGLRNDTEQQQVIPGNDSDDMTSAQEYRQKYGKLIEE